MKKPGKVKRLGYVLCCLGLWLTHPQCWCGAAGPPRPPIVQETTPNTNSPDLTATDTP